MRHVDLLEQQLGVKLFQRHQAGYTPTTYGKDLFEAAGKAEASFHKVESGMAVQSETASGKLVVTSTAMLLSTFTAVLHQYQIENPGVCIEYKVSEDVARLEVGEAHVAIRTGKFSQMEDTIMLPLLTIRSALYAHESYIERHGLPGSLDDFRNHRFVSRVLDDEKFPPFLWLREHIGPENVVFMSNDLGAKLHAVREGIGIGFSPVAKANAQPGLIEVLPSDPAWNVDFWLVTHIDNHRTPMIQALLSSFRRMGVLTNSNELSDIIPPKTVA